MYLTVTRSMQTNWWSVLLTANRLHSLDVGQVKVSVRLWSLSLQWEHKGLYVGVKKR